MKPHEWGHGIAEQVGATRRLSGFYNRKMDSKSLKIKNLQVELALLKKEEERFRFLVTSNRTSPEYRREATAKLDDTRRRIHLIVLELDGGQKSD
jgi:hypothetical protein